MKYQVLMTFEGPDEDIENLYKSPSDPNERALLQKVYELASGSREHTKIIFGWKEGTEIK